MADRNTPSAKLAHWFKTLVRPLFQKTEPAPALEELDKLAAQVEELGGRQSELYPICLLGQAGVGKSTLINTLVADNDIVVPSGGGTGPLTASALQVIYGETKSFVVRYHPPKQINQTRFILEKELARQSNSESAPDGAELDDDGELAKIDLDSEEQKKSRTEEAIGRARLLVAGAQNATRELPYLIDALRQVLGQALKFGTYFLEEDLARLRHVRDAVRSGSDKAEKRFDSVGNPDFGRHLRDHACGFLAPMILEMTIRWPSPLLQNSLELVDLPGIGVRGDVYENITKEYLRNRAKAVLIVADSRGLHREVAEVLRESGFLNRLLHSSDDLTADPVTLIVAAVKIDDVAVENHRNDRATNGTALKSRAQHFDEQVAQCRENMAHQLRQFLREVWQEDTQGKRDVIQSIIDNLQVVPVSAPQYRLLTTADPDDDKPFLRDSEATNIPALREAIADVARRCIAEQQRRAAEVRGRFLGQVRAKLEVLSAQWNDERRAEEDTVRFTESLNAFLGPLQREFDTRRGGFRTFLRKTIPVHIESKVEAASGQAQKKINRYLGTLRDAHWKTLQAAVRREGTFYGSRHINLPNDFALAFEEPIAEVWSREILVEVRKETREFADYQSAAVNQVLDWAREQGIRVSTRLLEALVEAVKQHRQQVNAVGKERVEELRERVRAELIKSIEAPIRRKCKKFVEDHQDYGAGVKSRIVDLFAQLAEDVVEAAAEPATRLLQERFREVNDELLKAFGEHSEPLNEAADALIQKHEKRSQAGEAKAREFAEVIDAALAAAPELEAAIS